MPKLTPTSKAMDMLRAGDDPTWVRQCTGVSYEQLRMLQNLLSQEHEPQDEADTREPDAPGEEAIGLW
ncbi:hypothetical protein [Bifidobacterium callitrichidarum]|uniref:hypothetical protein n=1 Tax=Bifidobacterium callitrichidarum TaxID=2052941 RepID=UPI000D650EDA|nr:hypothetical protein [Bifidobacterium callitrichidarum]